MKTSFLLLVMLISVFFVTLGCSPESQPKKKKTSVIKPKKSIPPKESRILKIAKSIVKEKGNLNQSYNSRFKIDDKGIPLLVWAVAKQDSEALKFLLDNGADPDSKLIARSTDTAIFESSPSVNTESSLAAYKARRAKTLNICEILIKGGADVKHKNKIGETILHKAAGKGRDDICALLIENGADFKAKDRMGSTPLHRAAQYASCKVVELLILKGADVNAKDFMKKTPLQKAEERLDEKLHKEVKKVIPKAYPYTDYDKVIQMLKAAGGE